MYVLLLSSAVANRSFGDLIRIQHTQGQHWYDHASATIAAAVQYISGYTK